MNLLVVRLIAQLNIIHRAYGLDPEPLVGMLGGADAELHEISPAGVLAFVNDYVLTAWPDDEIRIASPRAYRIMSERLQRRGFTLHMVHPLNFRSVKLTRKMGARPLGTDAEGFVHYRLESKDFPHPHVPSKVMTHGQEVSASEAA